MSMHEFKGKAMPIKCERKLELAWPLLVIFTETDTPMTENLGIIPTTTGMSII